MHATIALIFPLAKKSKREPSKHARERTDTHIIKASQGTSRDDDDERKREGCCAHTHTQYNNTQGFHPSSYKNTEMLMRPIHSHCNFSFFFFFSINIILSVSALLSFSAWHHEGGHMWFLAGKGREKEESFYRFLIAPHHPRIISQDEEEEEGEEEERQRRWDPFFLLCAKFSSSSCQFVYVRVSVIQVFDCKSTTYSERKKKEEDPFFFLPSHHHQSLVLNWGGQCVCAWACVSRETKRRRATPQTTMKKREEEVREWVSVRWREIDGNFEEEEEEEEQKLKDR